MNRLIARASVLCIELNDGYGFKLQICKTLNKYEESSCQSSPLIFFISQTDVKFCSA